MERNYNRTRHLEFLKRKNLGEKLSIDEAFEFLGYRADIENYCYWKNRFKLSSMMKRFLNGVLSKPKMTFDCGSPKFLAGSKRLNVPFR